MGVFSRPWNSHNPFVSTPSPTRSGTRGSPSKGPTGPTPGGLPGGPWNDPWFPGPWGPVGKGPVEDLCGTVENRADELCSTIKGIRNQILALDMQECGLFDEECWTEWSFYLAFLYDELTRYQMAYETLVPMLEECGVTPEVDCRSGF